MSSSIPRSVALYRRTIDHLRAWPFKLPNHIKIASVNFNEFDKAHDGLRLFTYQHIPQLKFHNPDVKFIVSRNSDSCTMEFIANGDDGSVFELNEKTHKDVKNLIQELYPQDSLATHPLEPIDTPTTTNR